MLAELTRQFQRMHAGLSASRPRGNARKPQSAFRMLAAWGKANNIDAQLKQAVTDAVALDGHHELVSKLSSFDWVADAKTRGIVLPPNFLNPTYTGFRQGDRIRQGGLQPRAPVAQQGTEDREERRALQPPAGAPQRPSARRADSLDSGPYDVDGDGVPDSIDGYDDREQDQTRETPPATRTRTAVSGVTSPIPRSSLSRKDATRRRRFRLSSPSAQRSSVWCILRSAPLDFLRSVLGVFLVFRRLPMTEQPSQPTRLHAAVQLTSLIFSAAFLALIWWTYDSPLNRWILGPLGVFFVIAGLWKAWRFFRRSPAVR